MPRHICNIGIQDICCVRRGRGHSHTAPLKQYDENLSKSKLSHRLFVQTLVHSTAMINLLAGDGGEMQKEERSSITISEEYDRVYTGVNDPVLNDKGTGKAVSEK